ncbi:MAG: hypothetical protein JWM89_1117 [Acidimicrobiales bacterium]|nr:hypothetical protein [Acidimicrobiales bacterium]
MVVFLVAVVVALGLAAAGSPTTATTAGAATTIASRGATTVTYRSASTRTIRLSAPVGAASGDVLLASLGLGATAQPTITAPNGWVLASRTNRGSTLAIATYTHTFVAGESAYSWSTDRSIGGVAFLAAFGGVDTVTPVMASAGNTTAAAGSASTPSVTTTQPGSLLVAAFAGSTKKAKRASTWSVPSGMGELGDVADADAFRSGSLDQQVQPAAGASGAKSSKPSTAQDETVAVLTALRPAATTTTTTTTTSPTTTTPPTTTTTTTPSGSGPTPLIVDTDLFSDADDVGALATAFGLQLRGEAKVVAIGLNTRTSRPNVAVNSWRCALAVAAYYGSASVPIGTSMPNTGTDVNTVDFVKPCAALAPASTPTPASAVTVFRQALAAQADGSVVVVEAGYNGNLAALLASPGDATSPLGGQDLVARKVKRLVIMGGGYPSRSGENNLVGDPAAAQQVSSGWPTKIVWAGYEVGDAIHTGDTISRTHPSTSPVRVAYEAFVGPNNWIYSYDLVAVYDAIRPSDTALREVGPGTNAIDSSGRNTFTLGTGNQYYLTLSNATAVDASIEQLITTLPTTTTPPPPAPPPPPSTGVGPADTFDTSALSSTWTTITNGSTVVPSGGRLVITHPAGSWTSGTLQSTATHDQTGRSLQVQVVRPANGGVGGSTYGETSVYLWLDATHSASFFFASGSLTAWVANGGPESNLTPSWPTYVPAQMQWLRFREAAGRLYWEYASGATAPGTWTVLTSTPDPFALTAVRMRITAGANVTTTDAASFDNIFTS